jgi:DnaJ-domain-containing protein 1
MKLAARAWPGSCKPSARRIEVELMTPPVDVARAGLRALKCVAVADGQLHALERRLLESVEHLILQTDFDLDALTPIAPEQLAAAVPQGELRERILSACIIMALIDGEASAAEANMLEKYARAFELSSPALRDVQRLVENNLTLARIDIARRSFLGQRGRAYLADNGVRGFARILGSLFGIENAGLAQRYRALADKPRGTLGRGYFEFIRASGRRVSRLPACPCRVCDRQPGGDSDRLVSGWHAGEARRRPRADARRLRPRYPRQPQPVRRLDTIGRLRCLDRRAPPPLQHRATPSA